MRKPPTQEQAEEIFEFVLDSVERTCGISATALMSSHSGRVVVNVRRMLCKMLSSMFQLQFTSIGKLLNKNHATVIFHLRKHDDFYVLEKDYAKAYDDLLQDVSQRIRTMNYVSLINGTICLKEIHSSEKETFEIMMASFTSATEAQKFVTGKPINRDAIVYQGPTSIMPVSMANEIVFNDEKKYVEGLMFKSRDLYGTIMDAPVDRHYLDYTTGLCTIKNDPLQSFLSAASMLGNKSITIVYTQRRSEAVTLQSTIGARTSAAPMN